MYPDGAQLDLLSASAFQRPIHSAPAGVFLHAHAGLTHTIVSRRAIRPLQARHFCCSGDLFALPLFPPSECQRFTNI